MESKPLDYSLNQFVSVIIPVFNDTERLTNCLDALENQTYLKNFYEVIVVDNGSNENISSVVIQFSQASTAYENCPGSYAARNKGILLAKGEIIAFTDSDCIPASDWIEKGVVSLLRVPKCGLVAGKIEIFFKNPNQPTAVELYESVTAFPQHKYVKESKWGATANLFTFKSVIEDVGLFDNTFKSGGDVEWGQRVFSFGYTQVYADDCRVSHPARYSFNQLYRKVVRVSGGIHDFAKRRNKYPHVRLSVKPGFNRSLGRVFKPPLQPILKIYLNTSLDGNKQKIKAIFVVLFVHYLTIWERIKLQLGAISER